MTKQHPITPPPELIEQWRKEPEYTDGNKLVTMVTMTTDRLMQLCEKSAQHGADQELEACCEWLVRNYNYPEAGNPLRAALAQPEPVAPTDEELLASVRHFYGDQTAADMGAEDDLRTARAVPARWGTPAIAAELEGQ
jgi:hypothetical protein